MPAVETYFIAWKGRRDGPYSLAQLAELLERGEIGLLHRVETSSGLQPLRELLLADDPDRWSKTAAPQPPPEKDRPPGLLGSSPRPRTFSSASDSSAESEPEPDYATESGNENLDDDQARQIYTICGLCFLMPPLAGWSWKMAGDLSTRGFPQTAKRLKWISASLAASGLVLWGLVWRLW